MVTVRADAPLAAVQADPMTDLTTELERQLGKLVKAKHGTDFYILTQFPLGVSQRAGPPPALHCLFCQIGSP